MSRSIFEDVGAETTRPGGAPQPREAARAADRRRVRIWLLILAVMVVAQIIIGGLTRITDSGLSITRWDLVTGVIPPLSEQAWLEALALYRETTEYQEQNAGMTLDAFKVIYWWEWAHRFWGRLIGVAFLAPFAWFLYQKAIPRGWLAPIAIAGGLGALQGVIGWWMVQSGLVGRTDVSQHRLAIHLTMAFVILGLLFWTAFSLKRDDVALLQARRRREAGLWTAARLLMAALAIQLFLGAYVAGLDAGLVYGDWPTMGGGLYPAGEPFNPFENQAASQFMHRMFGYLLLIGAAAFFWLSRGSAYRKTRLWGAIALGLVFTQMLIGIATLVHGAPASWAATHHAMAVIVFVGLLHGAHQTSYPAEERIAG